MPEELGKIEKLPVEDFKGGRKLFFVPLIFGHKDLPPEFTEKYNRYWEQVESQLANLEMKLGPVKRIFHELVPESGEKGLETLKKLNVNSHPLIQKRMEKGAVLEALEDNDIITELMDWSRCLSLGLQNQKVFSTVYGFYTEATQKRNEYITKKIPEALKADEIGILIMAEGHHIQFPADIGVFYVAPPALDELKRWLRDYEAKAHENPGEESPPDEHTGQPPDH
jgi:hypothetical protein